MLGLYSYTKLYKSSSLSMDKSSGSSEVRAPFLNRFSLGRLCVVVVAVAVLLFIPFKILTSLTSSAGDTMDDSPLIDAWPVRLVLNLLGYATIVVPGYLIIRYVKQTNYLETAGTSLIPKVVRMCVYGAEDETPVIGKETSQGTKSTDTVFWRTLKLLFCTGGLQISYLIWGILQERIMSIKYGETDTDPGENFKNSQFLVFVNRILALVIAILCLIFIPQPHHTTPLHKYSYSSFSNIMSSWFQYEALKFVSFPTQVLAKASKVIPVMLMGKIVSKNTYEMYEYVSAIMISLGVSMFLLTSDDATKDRGTVTTFSGVILLIGYLLFDAFTSNWQGQLFKSYKVSSLQMMAGVNLFSVIFTTVSLVEQGGFIESAYFMTRHSDFFFHSVLLSICSASGQLFIFYTIGQFGAVTFAIIMTIRQGLAILLSCLIYGHPVTVIGVFGVMIVFAAIFMKIYFNNIKKAQEKANKKTAPLEVQVEKPISVPKM